MLIKIVGFFDVLIDRSIELCLSLFHLLGRQDSFLGCSQCALQNLLDLFDSFVCHFTSCISEQRRIFIGRWSHLLLWLVPQLHFGWW